MTLQAASELHHMKVALTRATMDEYHQMDPAGHDQELKALQDHRARKRQDFSNQFLATLHQHEMVKHSDFLQVCLLCQ